MGPVFEVGLSSLIMKNREYKNIAFIRLSSLGDIVHAIPAFHVLKTQFPGARISWFVQPAGAKLLQLVEGIDEIVVFNLKVKGSLNKLSEVRRILKQYRGKFDLIIDLQGLIKSAMLGWLLKGHTVGFGKGNLKESQARFFYNETATPFDETQHVIFKNIHIVRGLKPGGAEPEDNGRETPAVVFPVEKRPMSTVLTDFLQRQKLEEGKYAIINVGGGWESKLLTINQYTEIIRRIREKCKAVILWGTPAEKERAECIARECDGIVSPFLGFADLTEFIRHAGVLVTADTLALHLADVVKRPSVGIFGPTSPTRNGSLLEDSISVYEKMHCGFCYKKKCGTIECLKKINIERIIESIETIHEKRN
jgi:heptosyltransferase I